jgi:hypothetical protein
LSATVLVGYITSPEPLYHEVDQLDYKFKSTLLFGVKKEQPNNLQLKKKMCIFVLFSTKKQTTAQNELFLPRSGGSGGGLVPVVGF